MGVYPESWNILPQLHRPPRILLLIFGEQCGTAVIHFVTISFSKMMRFCCVLFNTTDVRPHGDVTEEPSEFGGDFK